MDAGPHIGHIPSPFPISAAYAIPSAALLATNAASAGHVPAFHRPQVPTTLPLPQIHHDAALVPPPLLPPSQMEVEKGLPVDERVVLPVSEDERTVTDDGREEGTGGDEDREAGTECKLPEMEPGTKLEIASARIKGLEEQV